MQKFQVPGGDVMDQLNGELASRPAEAIIEHALALGGRAFATTSFGPHAAVLLHMLSQLAPGLPVVWVDTGYNLRDTYRVAEQLMERLRLNMQVYTPLVTAERRNALFGGIPTIDETERHREFTRQVKLEPFRRAVADLNPDIWFTGIRAEETEHRRGLDVLSRDPRGMLKVAPLFHWTERDLDHYLQRHDLPTCRHYFDPTKVADGRECGLHTAA
jgi:phosphoadenosine phosphosulfate reductase